MQPVRVEEAVAAAEDDLKLDLPRELPAKNSYWR